MRVLYNGIYIRLGELQTSMAGLLVLDHFRLNRLSNIKWFARSPNNLRVGDRPTTYSPFEWLPYNPFGAPCDYALETLL